MIRRLAAVLATAAVALFAAGRPAVAAPTFPPLTGRVVDAAHVLDAATVQAITERSQSLEQSTGRQLVVATVPSLDGLDVQDYGYQLGRAWKIGQAGKNTGVVLVVAPSEKKVGIEVGYGLEGTFTDALSSVVLQERILPKFRAGDVNGGVRDGADAIADQLALPDDQARQTNAQAATAQDEGRHHRHSRSGGAPGIVGVIILFAVLSSVFRGRRRGLRGGGGGMGWLPWVVLGAMGSGRGRDDDWGGGGGGFGGGGFGDGGGGGGFSGGGGSFGGGGALGKLVGELVMAKTTLTADDRRAIASAVGRAEEGTAGEIVCVLAPEADDYAEVPVAWAALAAIVAPFLLVLAGLHPTLHLAALGGTGGWDAPGARDAGPTLVDTIAAFVGLQALAFALVFLAGQVPAVRRFLTPGVLKRAKVRKGAQSQFSATGLAASPERTGVLIYASLGDRMVEVIADRLIHDRVGEAAWRDAVEAVSKGMRGGVTGGGFVRAVEVCGAALSAHFPPTGAKVNAFPDELREL